MPYYPGVTSLTAAAQPGAGAFGKDGSPQFSTFTTTLTPHDHTHTFGSTANAFTIMFGGEAGPATVTSVVIDPAGANISCSAMITRTTQFAQIWAYEAHGLSGLSGARTIRITWGTGAAGDSRGRVQSQSYNNADDAAPTPISGAVGTSGSSTSIPLTPLDADGIIQFGLTINTNQAVAPSGGLTEIDEYQDATTTFTTWYGEQVGALTLGSPSQAPGATWTSTNRIAAVAFVVNPSDVVLAPVSWAYPLQTSFTDRGAIITQAGWDAAVWNTTGNVLVSVGNTAYLFYNGGDVWQVEHAEHSQIGVATSTNGINWTEYASNPICSFQPLTNGGSNPNEEGYWHHGVHRRSNGTWTCVFGGQQGDGATTVEIDIFMQTSNDGLSWTPNTATGRIEIINHLTSGFAHYSGSGSASLDEIGATGLWYDETNGIWHITYVGKTIAGQEWTVYHAQGSNLQALTGANSNVLLSRANNPFVASGYLRAGPIVDRGNGVVDVIVLALDAVTDTEPGDITTIARVPILPNYSWTAPGPAEILYYWEDDFAVSSVVHSTLDFFPAQNMALLPYNVCADQLLKIKTAPAVQTSDGRLSYSPVGARFTGASDQYLNRAGLTGQASSGRFTTCFAIKMAAAPPYAEEKVLLRLQAATYRWQTGVNPDGTVYVIARNSASTVILNCASTTTVSNDKWYTVVISFDMANYANCYLYIDRVSRKPASATTFTAGSTIDFAGNTTTLFGHVSAGAGELDAEVADFGFLDGVAFDLSNSLVLNRFVTPDNELQNPGVDGRRMFLRRARVFFSGNGTDFPTNRGTGGAFTTNAGPLTNSSTNPSGHP